MRYSVIKRGGSPPVGSVLLANRPAVFEPPLGRLPAVRVLCHEESSAEAPPRSESDACQASRDRVAPVCPVGPPGAARCLCPLGVERTPPLLSAHLAGVPSGFLESGGPDNGSRIKRCMLMLLVLNLAQAVIPRVTAREGVRFAVDVVVGRPSWSG